ncbi:MAG: hypothetical protein JO227_10390 [Acetobacteraceae bacterium]|nr:hypothetical protein [Acetobacteraceae bacterium]
MSEAATAVLSNEQTQGTANSPPIESAQNRVTELRVTGHLMTLEAGLFCILQAPGAAALDQATGLPGVRISLPPGPAGRPDAVSISTFRPDGWLDQTAALVRVTQGPAQILVTVYQLPRQGSESAPRLQVLRLSGEPAAVSVAEEPAVPRLAAVERAAVVAHVHRTGDVGGGFGNWIGTRGSRMWIEGFALNPKEGIAAEDLEYQGVLGRGWMSPWVDAGKFCGSRGMALPLLGLKIRLKGNAAKTWECTYSATFTDGSAVGPIPAGETCEAETLAPLEAFQVELRRRESKTTVEKPASAKSSAPTRAAAKPARAKSGR